MTRLKVLIPLDGSKLAEASLSQVSSLRELGDVELELVSVVDDAEDFRALSSKEAVEREHNVLATYLEGVANDLKKHLGLNAETRVLHGNPAESLIKEIQDYGADLVLISSHGRSGLSRWRLGSVADKVIRAAPANIMVMGPKAAQIAEWYAEVSPPFPSVLVALDGSELAEASLGVAKQFVEGLGSTLHLVRIVTVPAYGDMSGEMMYPNLLTDLVSAAESYLSEIPGRIGLTGSITSKVLIGSPAAELLGYVADHAISLVVMTTHGRGGIVRSALGSVTDRLLGSEAPVFVVKPPSDGDEA